MPTLDDHDDRIRRLETIVTDHDTRMQELAAMMGRVIALNELVVQLLQRQNDSDAHNGH